MSYVSSGLINQVSGGVSQSAVDAISAFQNNVRSLLQLSYDTFLQGSYANDTEIKDFNDVDIVALQKPLQGLLSSFSASTNLFYDVKTKLETNQNYRGRITVGRKCLTLDLGTRKADIVPARRTMGGQPNAYGEPILIGQNIPNYPKTHISIGQAKNQRTNNNYKRVVRMVKNYVNKWNLKGVAPSFYVECMIYSYTDATFSNDLPYTLNNILTHMVGNNFSAGFRTVAGDKIVISQTEWFPQSFFAFRQHVAAKLPYLSSAVMATSEANANSYFRSFFNI